MRTIINLFGPSAAGKSTLAKLLQKDIENLQIIDFDIIKREIPNYDWSKHAQDGRNMTLKKLAFATSHIIMLLMPSPKDEAEFNLISTIADKEEYKLLNIEVTAPKEVLIERYRQRLANIEPSKKDWRFKTLDEFIEKIGEPYFKPHDTLTFDTSLESSEAIEAKILKHVNGGI